MTVRTLLLGTAMAIGLAGTAAAQDAVIRTGGTDAVFASQNTERMWEAVAYSNPLPPGAPTADYPLVAWCEAMVSGHVALGESEYWSNPVTAIGLESGAHMRHYKLQEESPNAWQNKMG